jgi:hypothetical protein
MTYKSEQDDYFEDWELEQRQKKNKGARKGVTGVTAQSHLFEKNGIDVAASSKEMLTIWKQCTPLSDFWNLPEAEPMIDFLFG